MKYVVFLGDGMADTPVEALEGKTPLAVANKQNIDALAPVSEIGIAKTVPDGMKPGSDTANLAVLGYNPKECYSGRSPLEALSMGLTLQDTDIAVRCNLVTLSDEDDYTDKTMVDYSAGEISTEEGRELIAYVNEKLGTERLSFHGGISYRHCLIVHDAEVGSDLTPPHDITGKKITRHLPAGKLGDLFLDLQKKSYELLKDHPINVKRMEEGKNPANSIWLWGEGTKPSIPDFYEKNGIHGAIISAVDLLKGIGKGANMKVINVEGATGNVNTDFAAKGRAAIDALKEVDYVYIHVEAPDESGHQGSLSDKIKSIEKIDADIVGPVLAYLKESGEPYHVLVCPDHPTPLATRTHSAEPIPYLIYKSDAEIHSGIDKYDEENAKATGIYLEEGYRLIDKLLSSETQGNIEGITPDLVTYGDGTEEALGKANEAQEEAPAEETVTAEEISPEEKTSDEESEAPIGDAEGEPKAKDASTENKSEEKPEEKKKEKKPKKKGAFKAFLKKHWKVIVIVLSVLLIAGGLAAGHFITTYHYAFIRSEEDLDKALANENITRLIFKKDVATTKDVTITRAVDFDMNEYTFTVKGALSLSISEDTYIGYKKGKAYVLGGMLQAEKITATGNKTLYLLSDLNAPQIILTCEKVDIKSTVLGTDTVMNINAKVADISGKTEGSILLSNDCYLALSNDALSVKGGQEIEVTAGNVGAITDTVTLYVYETANVDKILNVGTYYLVTKLATPSKVVVLNENNEYYCYVSEVIGATALSYTINGEAKDLILVNGGTAKFKLEDLVPGEQVLKIKATTSPENRAFLDSDEVTYTFEFAVKLATPVVSVVKNEDKIELVIKSVLYAEEFAYTVDGVSTTIKTDGADVHEDITDKVQEGGLHIVEVTAKSSNKYFTDSNTSMASYVTEVKLTSPVPTVTLTDDELTFTWEAVEGRADYLIHYGTDTYYIKDTTLTVKEVEGASFDITALAKGGDYRLPSDKNTALTAEVIKETVHPVVQEPEVTEPENED